MAVNDRARLDSGLICSAFCKEENPSRPFRLFRLTLERPGFSISSSNPTATERLLVPDPSSGFPKPCAHQQIRALSSRPGKAKIIHQKIARIRFYLRLNSAAFWRKTAPGAEHRQTVKLPAEREPARSPLQDAIPPVW